MKGAYFVRTSYFKRERNNVMETKIVVECRVICVGSEIISVEIELPRALGITEQCLIRQALVSGKTMLQIENEMIKMSYGYIVFFLKPIGCNVCGLENFFTNDIDASISYMHSNIQISKMKYDDLHMGNEIY